LIQGVSFTLLYIAWIERHLAQPFKLSLFWGISLLGLVTIVFFYPLLVIVLVYALLFLYFNSYKIENKRLYLHVFLVYSLLFILKLIFVRNFYDAGALNNLKNFYTLFPSYFATTSWKNFYGYLLKDYWGLILLFCLVVYQYFNSQKWLKLALFLSFFIGTIFLINICYKDGAEQFYLEGQYSILCALLGFSLAYDIVSNWSPKWLFGFLSMILILFIFRITSTRSVYSDRVNLYRNLITEFSHKKVILENHPIRYKTLKMQWGSSFETWLLSTTERRETSSIIIKDNPKDLDWALDKSKSFITEWEIVDYDKLNSNYFIFKDSGTYTKIQPLDSNVF